MVGFIMMNKEKGCNWFLIYHFRYHIKNIRSSIFNILSIAIGIAVFIVIQMIVLVNENKIGDIAKAKVGGDIGIVLGENFVDNELLDELDKLTLEKKIMYTKSIWSQGSVSSDNRNSLCVIRYINPKEYPYYRQLADAFNYEKLSNQNCIAVSKKLADSLNIDVGKSIKIQGIENSNSDTYKVIAIVPDDGEDALDMNIYGYVFMDESKLFENLSVSSRNIASKIYIKCEKTQEKEIVNLFRNQKIQLVQDEVKKLEDELNSTEIIYNSMGVLSILIAFIGIISSVILQIIKRQKEICILKLYGATDIKLAFNFLKEFLFLVFLGMIIGLVCGLIFSQIICNYILEYNLNSINLLNIIQMFVKILIFGAVSGIIFGAIPIILTLQYKPVEILRERTNKKTSIRKLMIFSLLVGICIYAIIFSIFIGSLKGLILIFIFALLIGVLYAISCVLLRMLVISSFSCSIRSIALKSLKKDNKKFSFIVLVISICVAVIGMILLIYNSILPSLESQVENSLGYNALFKVNAKEEKVVNNLLEESKDTGYFISTIVDFSLLAINGTRLNQSQENIYSLDCIHNDMEYVNNSIMEGSGLSASSNINEIVLDEEFSMEHHINVGDMVTLLMEGHECIFNVTGIKNTDKIKTGHAYASYSAVSKYTSSEVLRYYVISNNTESFIKYINKNLDDIVVLNIEDISAPYAANINKQIQMLKLVSLLSILTSMFLIFNVLSIIYIGKRKEFLILDLYGANKNRKLQIVVEQGIRIGLSSSVVSFIISVIGSLIMEILTGISINYDFVSFIEIIVLSVFGSLISVIIVSVNVVNYNKYDLLRTE